MKLTNYIFVSVIQMIRTGLGCLAEFWEMVLVRLSLRSGVWYKFRGNIQLAFILSKVILPPLVETGLEERELGNAHHIYVPLHPGDQHMKGPFGFWEQSGQGNSYMKGHRLVFQFLPWSKHH